MAQFPLRQVPTCGWPGQADARNAYVRVCLHNLCDGIKMLDLVESAANLNLLFQMLEGEVDKL